MHDIFYKCFVRYRQSSGINFVSCNHLLRGSLLFLCIIFSIVVFFSFIWWRLRCKTPRIIVWFTQYIWIIIIIIIIIIISLKERLSCTELRTPRGEEAIDDVLRRYKLRWQGPVERKEMSIVRTYMLGWYEGGSSCRHMKEDLVEHGVCRHASVKSWLSRNNHYHVKWRIQQSPPHCVWTENDEDVIIIIIIVKYDLPVLWVATVFSVKSPSLSTIQLESDL